MSIINPTLTLTQLFDEAWLNKVDAIADLHRAFNGIQMDLAASVAYKPFHNQLRKTEFARFMEAVVAQAIRVFSNQLSAELPSKLKQFNQVLLQDGSSFAIHPDLAEIFPNRFKGKSPAAVECHMTMSLQDEQPAKLSISADTASERQFLPAADTLTNSLLLADAGYVGIEYMSNVQRHQGYFLMRSSKLFNPTITRALNSKGKELKSYVGIKLKALQQRRGPKAQVLDLDVKWPKYQCRMVMFWHTEEKHYLWWITNLPREQFSAEDVNRLYRVRWQIELLFKEWKSYNNLKKFVTRQQHMVEGLIWASLLSLLIKRFIGRAAQQRLQRRLSLFKIAKSAQNWFEPIMNSLASKSLTQLTADLAWAFDFICQNCHRAQQSKTRQGNSFEAILEGLNA
ncbi:IS4 family transposase [Ferrimonas senticii]|uniref:IS4 family transposase n=1 Tax=Ferrimonas senticii TaxID=394566 RepID=UPI000424ED02|nr:IS4 family transposase [Ferrimonas senticii]